MSELNREPDEWAKLAKTAREIDLQEAIADIQELARERDGARRVAETYYVQILDLQKANREACCAYCGERLAEDAHWIGEARTGALEKHIKTCAKHPMRAMEAQLQAQADALRDAAGREAELLAETKAQAAALAEARASLETMTRAVVDADRHETEANDARDAALAQLAETRRLLAGALEHHDAAFHGREDIRMLYNSEHPHRAELYRRIRVYLAAHPDTAGDKEGETPCHYCDPDGTQRNGDGAKVCPECGGSHTAAAPKDAPKGVPCSICRLVHGPEVVHACE